ncbi:MAG: hypothetical protein JNJ54_15375 [Myxococcaceae bacterium]|nr:hypothetical protein [Myxococcaceae bacterium]
MRVFSSVVVAVLVSACGPDSVAVWTDAAEDEGVELVEAELTASAIFAFLNGPDATVELLDGEVGLDGRAARNIVAHVRGPDGALGTGDDDLLQSIAELDAIAWVGASAIAAIDRYATPRYGLQDVVVEGVRFSGAEAAEVVAVCNDDARLLLNDVGLTGLQRQKLQLARPHTSIATVAATYGIGSAALTKLRDFAARALGSTPTPPPAPATCQEAAGKRDGVFFTAADACKAVTFLNTARTSDMWRLPRTALDFVYFGGPNRPLGVGLRSRWSALNEYTDAAGVGTGAVTGLFQSLAAWTPGGPTSDTVADAWARRAELVDRPVRFDRAFVSRVFPVSVDPNRPWIAYACGELRDAPGAATYVQACFTMVGADSAGGCQAENCYANRLNTWVQARGELARSTVSGSGGFVIWLSNSGFGTPAP